MEQKNNYIKDLAITALLLCAVGVPLTAASYAQSSYSSYSDPTANPVNDNPNTALNVGTAWQIKIAGLSINGLDAYDDFGTEGSIRIGSAGTPQNLIDISTGTPGVHGIRYPDGTVQASANYVPAGGLGGFFPRSTTKNFGSDWTTIMFRGMYINDDKSIAGALISKIGADWRIVTVTAGSKSVFTVTTTYTCGSSGRICAQKMGDGSLQMWLSSIPALSYVVFK